LKRIAFGLLAIVLSISAVLALLSLAFLIELRFRASHADPAIEWLDQRQVVLRPYGLWTHPTLRAGTNADGFRFHRDFVRQRQPGTTRIAILGGSGVWGTGVSADQTIAAHLEAALIARGVPGPEVLNFGIGGFDSTTELIQLSLNTLRYNPDHVVVFDGWNDLAARRFVPHLNDIAARYKSVLDKANFGASGLRLSIENALLSTYTGRPFAYFFRYTDAESERDRLVRETAERDMALPVELPPEDWSSEVYHANLKSIAGVLSAHEVGLLLAFQPYNKTVFEADGWGHERAPYLEFERAFFQACRETRSRCYSFDRVFQGREVDGHAFIDVVHLSDFGGRVVGDILAQLLLPALSEESAQALPREGYVEPIVPPAPAAKSFPFTIAPRTAAPGS
jgi:hypothetical protein